MILGKTGLTVMRMILGQRKDGIGGWNTSSASGFRRKCGCFDWVLIASFDLVDGGLRHRLPGCSSLV
jgi:hypothetical protein